MRLAATFVFVVLAPVQLCSDEDDWRDTQRGQPDWDEIFEPGIVSPDENARWCTGQAVELVGRRSANAAPSSREEGVFVFNNRVACRSAFSDQNLATCLFTPPDGVIGSIALEFGSSNGETISTDSMVFVNVAECEDLDADT